MISVKAQEREDFEAQAKLGRTRSEVETNVDGGEDSADEAYQGHEVTDDLVPTTADGGDGEKDDVACHGVGEDVAVIEIDDGVQQASGGRQEHGVGEGAGLDVGVERWHGW